MANEATIIELLGDPKGKPIRFTVPNNDAIEKGALLELLDPRTASGASAITSGAAFAGIAAEEKVAGDGSTSISAWTCGLFDIVSDVAIPIGSYVKMSGANTIIPILSDERHLGISVGKALEAADAAEKIAVAVGIY